MYNTNEVLKFLYAQKDHLTLFSENGEEMSGEKFFDAVDNGRARIDGYAIGGHKLVKETKSARMQLLIRPCIKDGLKEEAKTQKISLNELTNRIFEEYLSRKERDEL